LQVSSAVDNLAESAISQARIDTGKAIAALPKHLYGGAHARAQRFATRAAYIRKRAIILDLRTLSGHPRITPHWTCLTTRALLRYLNTIKQRQVQDTHLPIRSLRARARAVVYATGLAVMLLVMAAQL